MYEIRVAGDLGVSWAARFEGVSMRHEPGGETVLSGMLDQATLSGVLMETRSSTCDGKEGENRTT